MLLCKRHKEHLKLQHLIKKGLTWFLDVQEDQTASYSTHAVEFFIPVSEVFNFFDTGSKIFCTFQNILSRGR